MAAPASASCVGLFKIFVLVVFVGFWLESSYQVCHFNCALCAIATFVSSAYFGLLAPANLPRDILARLHASAVKAAQQPELRARLEPDGARVLAGTPEEFRAFLVADVEKWRQVVKATGAKPE